MPTGFSYYKTHTIAGSADGALTDFQLRIVAYKDSGTDSGDAVYFGTSVQDDFDDVRFTSADGSTDLDYWRDQSTLVSGTSCVFWVCVPSIPAASDDVDIRVYYGNASATDASDIKATMLGGDDFRTLRLTQQVAAGAAPRWGTGITHIGGTLYFVVWDGSTYAHVLYKTEDGGLTAPTSVSTVYSASSDRSHSNIGTDGAAKLYVTSKHPAGTGIYIKTSTDAGSSWGSEVAIATGLTGATDPTPLYVSSSQLLVFARIESGTDFKIRCFESTDDGASWATKVDVHTEAMSGINSLEDVDAVMLASGRIIVAWEREVTEAGAASCRMRYSDDDAATWSGESTIVSDGGSVDDEGGSFAVRSNGTLDYFFGSNVNGGASYTHQQLWQMTYSEGGNSWSTPVLVNESYNGVENNINYDADDVPVALCTRQYAASGGTSSAYMLTMTRLTGDDLSDRSISQDRGLAYALAGGLWVESSLADASETRAFAVFTDYTGADAVIELLASAPSPLTAVDIRWVMRYGSVSDHYLLSLIDGPGVNKLQWFKRVSGTYTLLHDASVTPTIDTLYRIVCTLRGTNPTTLSISINGTAYFTNITEGTSSRTSGKIGVAAPGTTARRATLARHLFARKYTTNEPAHGAWSAAASANAFNQAWARGRNALISAGAMA